MRLPDPVNMLADLARRALNRAPATPAIEYKGRWINWGEMRAVADAVEVALADCGVGPDAPVAFVPRNRPSTIATLFSLIASGRTIRMIYAFQSGAGIARDIARLEPAAVIFDEQDTSDEVLSALAEHQLAGLKLGEMTVTRMSNASASAAARRGAAEPQIEILTSGTTGPPKQFPLPFAVIAKSYVGGAAADEVAAAAQPPFLLSFPIGNISGIYSTVPTLIKGQRAVLIERFSVDAWHEYVVRHRPVSSGVPPASLQAVLDRNYPPEDFASIKSMGSGAAPLDPTVQRAWEDRYGIPILLSYGATEFGGPVCMMSLDLYKEWGQSKFSSLGRPFGGSNLRVVDAERGGELPPNSEGLLEVVSGRIGPDWIRTSDIGVIDEDGFLWLKGRADGAIMRGGFKILPETIERALMLHPDLSESAVVGIADSRLGQAPAAMVNVKPGAASITQSELEAHLRQHVLATHIPTKWLIGVEIPRNPSMKIDKPGVRLLLEEA